MALREQEVKHPHHPDDRASLGGSEAGSLPSSGAAYFGSRGRGAVTRVLSSITAAILRVLSTGDWGARDPPCATGSPQAPPSRLPASLHRRGCAGCPHPVPHGAACYSAQVRRRLMKPVPGELPHSWGKRLINEASATAAGASARGTGTGTGSGRTDGQTAPWQDEPAAGARSEAGTGARQDAPTRGLLWRGWAETWHHGRASTLPLAPRPLLLARLCLVSAFGQGQTHPSA